MTDEFRPVRGLRQFHFPAENKLAFNFFRNNINKVNPPMRVDKDLQQIFLKPVLSKSIEWYAKEWIMDIIDDMLDPHQYGSCTGCSTTLTLAELIHGWVSAVETPGTCIIIYY